MTLRYVQNGNERRVCERYKVIGPAYAAIGKNFERMGHIMNISRSGLAFNYIRQTGDPVALGQTRIQISDNLNTLCEMPFISISDKGADLADPMSSVEIRIHRGGFGPLSPKQLNELIGFLQAKTAFDLVHH